MAPIITLWTILGVMRKSRRLSAKAHSPPVQPDEYEARLRLLFVYFMRRIAPGSAPGLLSSLHAAHSSHRLPGASLPLLSLIQSLFNNLPRRSLVVGFFYSQVLCTRRHSFFNSQLSICASKLSLSWPVPLPCLLVKLPTFFCLVSRAMTSSVVSRARYVHDSFL